MIRTYIAPPGAALTSVSTVGSAVVQIDFAAAAMTSVSTLVVAATSSQYDTSATSTYDPPPAIRSADTVAATDINGSAYNLNKVVRHPVQAANIGFGPRNALDRQIASEIIFNFPSSPIANKTSPPYVLVQPGVLQEIVISCGTVATSDTVFNLLVSNYVAGVMTRSIIVLHLAAGKVTSTTQVFRPCLPGDHFQAALPVVGSGLKDFVCQGYF